jgi:hypothetical protein
MLLSEAIRLVRRLCNVEQTTGLFNDISITDHLNMAQRTAWQRLIEKAPDRFIIEDVVVPTYTPDRFNYRTSEEFTKRPTKIVGLFGEASSGSGNSARIEFCYVTPRDLPDRVEPYGYYGMCRWTLMGPYLVIRPVPTGRNLIVQYIPDVTALDVTSIGSIDEDAPESQIFDGEWPEFVDLVLLRAANLALESARSPNDQTMNREEKTWFDAESAIQSNDNPLFPR